MTFRFFTWTWSVQRDNQFGILARHNMPIVSNSTHAFRLQISFVSFHLCTWNFACLQTPTHHHQCYTWFKILAHDSLLFNELTSNRHHAHPTERVVPPLHIVLSRCGISQVIAARNIITSNSKTRNFCPSRVTTRFEQEGLPAPAHSFGLNAFRASTSFSFSAKGNTLVTRRVWSRCVVRTLSI